MKSTALWLTVLLSLVAGCDRATQISGVVRDTSGQPLSGALIVLQSEEQLDVEFADSAVTGPSGTFRVGFIHAPFNIALSLTASKPGYATYRHLLTADETAADSLQEGGYRITLAIEPER